MKRWAIRGAMLAVAAMLFLVAWVVCGQQQPAQPQQGQGGAPGGRGGGFMMQIRALLKQAGLTEAEIQQVTDAARKRFQAGSALRESTARLRELATKPDATDEACKEATAKHREALKSYSDELEKLDKELDNAVHYSAKPKVEAILLSAGIIGPFNPMIFRRGPRREGPPGAGGQRGERTGRRQRQRLPG